MMSGDTGVTDQSLLRADPDPQNEETTNNTVRDFIVPNSLSNSSCLLTNSADIKTAVK